MILLRPYWLLALIPLAVLLWWCWQRRPAGTGWQKLLPPHLAKHLLTGSEGVHNRWPLLVLAGAWLLATLAMAGPSWNKDEYPLYQLKGGRVLLMDMSLSMHATDLAPDRQTQAKYKAIDLVRRIKEGETGLIAYAAQPFTIAPLTRDGGTLEHLLQALSPEIMPAQGSRADLAVAKALALLKQAGYRRGDILLFTDGLSDKEASAIRDLDLGPFTLSALVFGTEQGAPIRTLSGELLKDGKGQVIIPQTDLNLTCGAVNGLCAKAGLDDGDLDALLTRPDDGKRKSDEVMTLPKDGGRYLLWLLLPLALLAFRRGLLVLPLMLVLPHPSQAAVLDGLFKNQNQVAYQQYQDKAYGKAAKGFKDANWQAAALYRDGKFEQAAQLWAKEQGPLARYNQGNALAKAGQLDPAIKAYDEALKLKPDFEDARFNRDLLEKQKQQQKPQDQKGKDKGKDKQKDKGKEQQDKDKGRSGDKKDGDKSEDPGKQQDNDQGNPQDKGDNAQKPKEPKGGEKGNQDAGQKPEQKKQGQQKDGQDQVPKPQGADDKGKDKASRQQGRLGKGDGDQANGPMLNADKLLDAVNDDPGYLLQQKMRRAYEARAKKGKEEQQW
ncbi:VWA domain-containing protein [Gallaecimonas kandeliae]|uniref:VWA domain-containing protein n=1 Tax=Gallaecimonas kandeliae TaxID=3029055 RepID=UPI002647A4F2|nr:VWA domain-containing protein [Gallaecimonas kandeliae]WKE64184.1 VWA domain-containing protein [Gallaecimonas kandeliae]